MPCAEGRDGEAVAAGRIYLAPGNYHMTVEGAAAGCVIRLNQNPPENFCRPSVDPMLRSLASFYGAALLTIILRSEEHTSELQSLMRNSYAVSCLKTKR